MESSEQTALINARPTEEENQEWQDERDKRTQDFGLNNKGEISERTDRQDFPGTGKNKQWYGTDGAKKRDIRRQSKIEDWDDPLSSDYDKRPPTDVDASPNEPIADTATNGEDESFDWQRFNSEVDQEAKPVDEAEDADAEDGLDVQDTGKFSFLDRLMRRNRAPKE